MHNKKEITIGSVLIILLIGLMNPGNILMPSMTQMTIVALATIVFAIFATLLWREHGGDERDQLHRLVADRTAFWITAIALMLALVVQGTMHMIDPWLPIILGAMVLGKIAGLIYSKNKL